MKKKQVKPLELHKETVRHLEDEKLRDAAAGNHTRLHCTNATVICSLCLNC